MKRLVCNYTILDINNSVISSDTINYTLSHYIAVLFKQNLNKNNIHAFWQNYSRLLNNHASVYYYFLTGSYSSIPKTDKITLSRLLHCIGFYIFEKENGYKPIIYKKGRVFLLIGKNNEVMSFGFTKKQKAINCSKRYHTIFSKNPVNGFLFSKNVCHVKVFDPAFDDKCDIDFSNDWDIIDQLFIHDEVEIKVQSDILDLSVVCSLYETDGYKNATDKYYDGKVYFYIKRGYKISKYIKFIDEENIAISLLSTEIIRLDDEKYFSLKAGTLTAFSHDEIEKLFEGSFIHSFIDETHFFSNVFPEFLSKSNKFGLVVITNTMCNARCPYCYQKDATKLIMNNETEKQLSDFILKNKEKVFHFTWFGGEPLLNTHVIDYITSFCKNQKIDYYSTMISNGYLLNKYIDKCIGFWKMKSIQITLDGVGDKYNRIKNTNNDPKAFDKVINNIRLLIDNNISVSIRLNFNKYNYLDILDCIDYVYKVFGNHPKIKIYANNIYGPKETFYLDDGTNLYFIIYKKLIELGYIKSFSDLRIYYKPYHCFANNKKHFVVNADGSLYNCEHGILEKETCHVGTLKDGITNDKNYEFWINNSLPYDKCLECEYRFLCQGGCKFERNYSDYEVDSCVWYKDIVDKLVTLLYKKR